VKVSKYNDHFSKYVFATPTFRMLEPVSKAIQWRRKKWVSHLENMINSGFKHE